MRSLISNGIVECYGPLVDTPGSYVAQFEHVSVAHELKTARYANLTLVIDCPSPAELQGGDLPRRRLLKKCEKPEPQIECRNGQCLYFDYIFLASTVSRPITGGAFQHACLARSTYCAITLFCTVKYQNLNTIYFIASVTEAHRMAERDEHL
jgi:hypothetical protein